MREQQPEETTQQEEPQADDSQRTLDIGDYLPQEHGPEEPATEQQEAAEQAEEETKGFQDDDEVVFDEAPLTQYHMMTYYKASSVAFRQKGGRQIGSLTSKVVPISILQTIGRQVLESLNKGMSPETALKRGKDLMQDEALMW